MQYTDFHGILQDATDTMKPRATILGIPFDAMTEKEALDRIAESITMRRWCHVVTPGPEFVMTARHNSRFQDILRQADLSLPDGTGILFAAKFLGQPALRRMSGMDFIAALCARAAQDGWRVYLFGGTNGVAVHAAAALMRQYRGLNIVGAGNEFRHWFRLPERLVCWGIRRRKPDILLVALGAPDQELWIDRNRNDLGTVRVAMGVGGAFDFLAGSSRRAPRLLQDLGLEWLWRLITEPRKRWRRIFTAVIRFPWAVVKEKVSGGSHA